MFKNVKAYFFDLDGTLVDSKLDFDLMREDLGFPKGVPILEHIDTLTCDLEIKKAHKIVLDHELKGANESDLFPGVLEFIKNLKEKNYPVAILTRNCKEATQIMLEKHNLGIEKVITREDFPPKPDPTALLYLAKHFNVEPQECIYIGDFRFDIEAAKNAGMQSAHFDFKKKKLFSDFADYSFESFEELSV